MRVVVAGQGYVGLPLAVRAAETGHRVTGYDVDRARVQQLAAGVSYVQDVSCARQRAVLASGAYRASADAAALAGFDVAVITVSTPLRDRVPDLTYVEACTRTLGEYLRPGALVVLESTSYPGTTEEVLLPVLEKASGLTGGTDFLLGFSPELLGFSPERIAPGNRRWPFEETPKLVSGIDAASLDAVRGLCDRLFHNTVPVSGARVAEMAKLIENVFRFVNISLANELATLARPLGVDIWEAIAAAATKPFGFMPFIPGPGVGGHCLPVDPMFLSWKIQQELGTPYRFVELADDINRRMSHCVIQRGLRPRPLPDARLRRHGRLRPHQAPLLRGAHGDQPDRHRARRPRPVGLARPAPPRTTGRTPLRRRHPATGRPMTGPAG